ncbi:MAG: hypothetical protein LC798_00285 [Chloroflexi bacterium]|nr:hypothetical protein [Chloroflexota bacterium]
MHSFLPRGLIAAALATATLLAPVATVHACSCAAFGTTADAVAAADLAFVGTVAGTAPGGEDPMMGVPLVRYAFEVERASQVTPAVVEVAALDDGGGPSCGFTFGVGERWLVVATSEGGSLRSNLCSGNVPVEGIGEAEMADLVALLPVEPEPTSPPPAAAPAASPSGAGAGMPLLAVLVGLAATGALIAVMVPALRRGGSR